MNLAAVITLLSARIAGVAAKVGHAFDDDSGLEAAIASATAKEQDDAARIEKLEGRIAAYDTAFAELHDQVVALEKRVTDAEAVGDTLGGTDSAPSDPPATNLTE